jgi:glycosyltransferase involved in cell wall biosynthesis
MRILHVTQPTEAGVARCVEEYARSQADNGMEVAVASPDGPLAKLVAQAGATPLHWDATRAPGPSLRREVRSLRKLVDEWRPDVVHLHSSKAGLAGRWAIRGKVPTVFQPHAWSFDAATGPMRRAILAWERRAARWIDLLLCVSEAERLRGNAHGISAIRSLVQPGGADLSRFKPADDAAKRDARERLGVDPDVPLAVCVGRLARQKGQDILLGAWPSVREQAPNAQLVLVGDGPEAESLQDDLTEGATIAGPSKNPQDWYAAADVVVVPSRWEGFPLVPLEAMATGRPVVGAAVTGMVEAIPAGTGALVRPNAQGPLARAVTTRLTNPDQARAEGEAARHHVERDFNANRLAKRLPNIYRSLAPQPA